VNGSIGRLLNQPARVSVDTAELVNGQAYYPRWRKQE
jgi:hypothetical protein